MMSHALLPAAAILGLLAYFEPCTIATHTLFTVRLHRDPPGKRIRLLCTIWFVRSLLVATLLIAGVLLIAPPKWDLYFPALVLVIMAMVYLISRYIYLPIPHLEFFRLLPGGKRLSEAVRLGLSLPACTIPLFIFILILSITTDSVLQAFGAGVLFATFFNLPMVVVAFTGIHKSISAFLTSAARHTPYLTAILFLSAALYSVLPYFDRGI